MRSVLALAVGLCSACTTTARTSSEIVPLADFHQHLVSPAFAQIAKLPERNGAALVRELDAAGIRSAVVLSVGYSFADERKKLDNPDFLTRQENDWTSAQVVANAPRLIGFCSANPLRDAAIDELDRCLSLPGMSGIKLHLGNGGISLRDSGHLARVQRVFGLAERRRVPVLVHMRARGGMVYGAEDARIFLAKVMPMAPSVEVIVAHLGASSPGYVAQNDEVMAVLAEAVRHKDPSVRNLYVDPSANVTADITPADAALITRRMRNFGLRRILYGSDLNAPGGSIAAGWEVFRTQLPLTKAELRTIANNRPRFLRNAIR
jgi:predicted TIM-barrel fold metal-dependent hydrolase